ncbi:MAG TPA: 2-hydroxyglutaryl-CoA dehydratase, partial [Firmicutes bacterium]|nr:2-hydroxyglutaryl-CoA dehydratase [Bacillota bacterium]
MAVAGIDVGSLTAGGLIFDRGKVLGYAIIPTGASSKTAAEKATAEALNRAGMEYGDLEYIVATGYGR